MNYEDRIVCFLDILGFKSHIAETINEDDKECKHNTDLLVTVFEEIRDTLDIDRPGDRKRKEVTQFSDSVVISFPSDEESGLFKALLDILFVQIILVYKGILCRGAIARGKLVHTPKMLFGPGMVSAYTLESKAAIYPRVILDQEIIDIGIISHARHHSPIHEEKSIMKLLGKDSDGMYYINYVTGAQSELNDPDLDYPNYLLSLLKIVSKGLRIKDPSVVVKYQWLKEKLKPHIDMIKTEVAKNKSQNDNFGNAYEVLPDL